MELKKFEYKMAQDMLKHYDTLNWQIGSILIAGVLLLTGLAINKEVIELMRLSLSLGISIGHPNSVIHHSEDLVVVVQSTS